MKYYFKRFAKSLEDKVIGTVISISWAGGNKEHIRSALNLNVLILFPIQLSKS